MRIAGYDGIFRKQNRLVFEEGLVLKASSGPDPLTTLDQDFRAAKLTQALQGLSPEHREVVLLKDVQGLSYKEIAEVMACSIGTVMSRLFYARQKLQVLLKDEYESR